MRALQLEAVHARAVKIGRRSKNRLASTANRLAACNVDAVILDIVSHLKPGAWDLSDAEIIEICAARLWLDFCLAEQRLACVGY